MKISLQTDIHNGQKPNRNRHWTW